MGSDNLHIRRSAERKSRKENILKQRSSNWLIVCEGTKTEPNYFEKAIQDINTNIEDKYRLKVKVVGKGVSTKSLVKATDLQIKIDKYSNSVIPYGKIFVVFDKDSFSDDDFDDTIKMCEDNGYIPLWSNQAIEYWFLLHFHYVNSKMDRKDYAKKLNEYSMNRTEIINISVSRNERMEDKEYPVVISCTKKNNRISAQNGVFVYFQHGAVALEDLDIANEILKKVVIPYKDTKRIMKNLYLLGMRFSSLYPELSSISKDIILKNDVIEYMKEEDEDE